VAFPALFAVYFIKERNGGNSSGILAVLCGRAASGPVWESYFTQGSTDPLAKKRPLGRSLAPFSHSTFRWAEQLPRTISPRRSYVRARRAANIMVPAAVVDEALCLQMHDLCARNHIQLAQGSSWPLLRQSANIPTRVLAAVHRPSCQPGNRLLAQPKKLRLQQLARSAARSSPHKWLYPFVAT